MCLLLLHASIQFAYSLVDHSYFTRTAFIEFELIWLYTKSATQFPTLSSTKSILRTLGSTKGMYCMQLFL